jgi:hypothetical protein
VARGNDSFMPESLDLFDPVNLRVPDSLLAQSKKSDQPMDRAGKPRRQPKASGFRFYQFPVKVLDDILKAANQNTSSAPVVVLLTLYKLWFKSFGRNPVQLTSHSLRKCGISRYQKLLALKLLEQTGHITVQRKGGKNPLVTPNWLPSRE